jgi:dynein heavy chain
MAKIQEYIELSRQFNSREFAVGKDPTDYSAVQTMLRDFNPYYNLWKTTNNWHNLENKWKTGAWDELSPTEVEEEFENSLKVINQVFRFFRDREGLKDIFKIAETMKAKIDEFKPIVPLAVYLRKDGMAQRHWTEISEKVGFEVDPEKDEEFSL